MRFDNRYKVYLDITAQSNWVWDDDINSSWVEVFVDINPFSRPLQTGEYFPRFKWDSITLRNEPYESLSLYDTISNLSIIQEIRIKIVTDNNTIRGYFGNNDCDFDDDNKVIKVTPAILDQYTEVLENYDKKVDATGGIKNYSTTYDIINGTTAFITDHNLPIKIKANNLDEAETPTTSGLPNSGGSFAANTKSRYNAKFKLSLSALYIVDGLNHTKIYIREYNSSNVVISEYLLEELTNTGIATLEINKQYEYTQQVGINSYLVLECDIGTNGYIAYSTLDFVVNMTSIALDTITVSVNLLKEDLVPKEVWTETVHGRASPKYTSWEDTNGVVDYFDDQTGAPTDRFQDSEFGTAAGSGATFSNDKDVSNDPISGLYLAGLQSALGEYEYELSSVTVLKGGFYRTGLSRTRKRRVFATCQFSREEYFKVDEYDEGELIPPSGDGWVTTEYFQNNTRMWIRKPFNGAYENDWELGDLDTSGGTFAGDTIREQITSKKAYPNGDSSRDFNTCRELREFIKTIYNGTSDLLVGKDVVSTFFWNDNEGDLKYFDDSQYSGSNYASQQNPNPLNRIACLHTYNLKTEITSSSANDSLLEVSFKELMDELKQMYPIYWFLDSDSTLHIEHVSYLDLTQTSSDVRGNPLIDETLKFKYDKTLMFESVEYNTVNSGYLDFTGNTMKFDRIASNKRNQDLSDEKQTEIFSSDLKYCMESPNDLDNGVLLINYDSEFNSVNSIVQRANQVVENGELAISTLLIKYWTYEGVWNDGKINNESFEFQQTSRTKEGIPISLKNVYDIDGSGKQILFVTTDLGIGLIKDMKIDFDRGTTEDVTLLYRYNSSAEGDGFVLIAADDVYFDFANYEN